MFEFIGVAFQAWREIAHIAAFTGLSVGVLVGLGFLAYLDPTLRKAAIRLAILVLLGYVILMYGMHLGSADKQAEWTAANIQAAKDAKARDSDADKAAEHKYGPLIAARDSMIASLKDKVDQYEKGNTGKRCPLGSRALFLRPTTSR